MIKKYISQSGVTIEIGDFYGGGVDHEGMGEVVSSFEDIDNHNINVITNLSIHPIQLKPGDYLGYTDGSGKLIKSKYDESDNG